MAYGKSSGGMGSQYGRGNRLAAALAPDAAAISNIKGDTQGLAYALEKGLQGLFAGMDAKEQRMFQTGFAEAMRPDPTTTIDMGTGDESEIDGAIDTVELTNSPGYSDELEFNEDQEVIGEAREVMGAGPALSESGLRGSGVAASSPMAIPGRDLSTRLTDFLSSPGMKNNRYAGDMAMPMAMQQMSRAQALTDRGEDREYKAGLLSSANERTDMLSSNTAKAALDKEIRTRAATIEAAKLKAAAEVAAASLKAGQQVKKAANGFFYNVSDGKRSFPDVMSPQDQFSQMLGGFTPGPADPPPNNQIPPGIKNQQQVVPTGARTPQQPVNPALVGRPLDASPQQTNMPIAAQGQGQGSMPQSVSPMMGQVDQELQGGAGEDMLKGAAPPSVRDMFFSLPPEIQQGIRLDKNPMQAMSKHLLERKGLDVQFKNGMVTSITRGGRGGSGGDGLQSSTRGRLEKDMMSGQKSLDAANYVEALYEPEFLEYAGAGRAKVMGILNKMDASTRDNFTARRAAFLSQTNQSFIAYRKWATGVAGGEKEMAEIKRATFSEDDSPQAFESKIESIKQMSRKLMLRQNQALKQGIQPGDKSWKKFVNANPLEGFANIEERGNKLRAMGYKDAQVKAILQNEGYK